MYLFIYLFVVYLFIYLFIKFIYLYIYLFVGSLAMPGRVLLIRVHPSVHHSGSFLGDCSFAFSKTLYGVWGP